VGTILLKYPGHAEIAYLARSRLCHLHKGLTNQNKLASDALRFDWSKLTKLFGIEETLLFFTVLHLTGT
jgi:hypothetical protein